MLSQEDVNKLNVLGIDVSKLTEAVKSDNEVRLEIPQLFTDSQFNEFGKNRFNEGKKAIEEITAKELKEHFKINAEHKDIKKLFEEYGNLKATEAGKKPSELENTIAELQKKLTDATTEKQKIQSDFQKRLDTIELKNNLSGLIPEGTKIGKEDIINLFLISHSVEKDDTGRAIVKKGDDVLKDNILNPLDLKTVINSFIDERGFTVKSGMGGNDRTGGGSGKFKDTAEFMAHCEKNGIDPMGTEGMNLLANNKDSNFKY